MRPPFYPGPSGPERSGMMMGPGPSPGPGFIPPGHPVMMEMQALHQHMQQVAQLPKSQQNEERVSFYHKFDCQGFFSNFFST